MIRISELLKLIKVGGKAMRLMTDEEIEILEKLEKADSWNWRCRKKKEKN